MSHNTNFIQQRTLASSITSIGIGLHSGKNVTLTLEPAPIGHGIVFQRTDIAISTGGAASEPVLIPAKAELVTDTIMSSNLVMNDVKVGTVEHLLSAVSAMGVDNLLIKVSDAEIPIMDGSALGFISLIQQAGIIEQQGSKQFLQIIEPVRVTDGDKWAEFLPYSDEQTTGFQLNFEISFEHSVIASTPQQATFDFSSQRFIDEISAARTFGFMKDIEYLRANGLALGGSLDNAVVVNETEIMNDEGLRFTDEFVRHKILDAVGDLYLIGHPIIGQYNAYKSGHAVNNMLIREVLANQSCFKLVTINQKKSPFINYY